MNTVYTRPKVDDLVFHLYSRALHPELFDTLAFRRVERDGYVLSVRITPAGHVLTWDTATTHLTEVTATRDQELPASGFVIRHRFHGERSDAFRPAPDVTYQMSSQVEVLTPELFWHVHEEILADGLKRGLLHHFAHHNRLALSPLGFVTIEGRKSSLSVATFHTFPDEFTIVKTQSLIERAS
jgi:hypothetical protein